MKISISINKDNKIFNILRWLRDHMLPKKIFIRSVTILLVMIIIIQAVITKVFLNSHWNKVTKIASETIASEVSYVYDNVSFRGRLKQNNSSNIKHAKKIAKRLGIDLSIMAINNKGNNAFNTISSHKTTQGKISDAPRSIFTFISNRLTDKSNTWEEKRLRDVLGQKLKFKHKVLIDDKYIKIIANKKNYELIFLIDKKRIINPTTDVFIAWAIIAPIVLLLIASFILRNQLRPIQKLAKAATRFGIGDFDYNFKPQGAEEIRSAGKAFLTMRERIIKQLNQRAEMLAAVSHDLRTPLTRIELQLSMMDQEAKEIQNLKRDADQMKAIVNDYLSFVRGEGGEKSEPTDIIELFAKTIKSFDIKIDQKLKQKLKDCIILNIRKSSIERMFSNIISNSLRYGDKVHLDIEKHGDHIDFIIEDNGKGIPDNEKENIFKPFYRIDSSRNQKTGGVGLGLSIAQDIAMGHGGIIKVEKSKKFKSGARFIISIPIV